MTGARAVHLVVPDGIADPLRPSGGNTYDRRLGEELTASGWMVHAHAVGGDWPWAAEAARRDLEATLGGLPGGALVVVDGLIASTAPDVLVPASRRLRLVVLLHMPVGADATGDAPRLEQEVLGTAAAILATSDWSRRWVLTAYGLDPDRVHVATPGVDTAPPTVGSTDGGRLLCVGAVLPTKGQDVLVAALARLRDVTWQCLCVGPLGRDCAFVRRVIGLAREAGLDDRFRLAGCRTGAALDATYADADLLVHPSRAETYGMVVTEALARGVPVVAADVGGVAEALGTAGGGRPGMLVPSGDAEALASSLRAWLTDASTRERLRRAARQRRCELTDWSVTAGQVAGVLERVAA